MPETFLDGKQRLTMAQGHGNGGTSAHFWHIVERELKMTIPPCIKHLLRVQNLDNHDAFRRIGDNIIGDLEMFARSAEYKSCVPSDLSLENLKEYYGIYAGSPSDFRFTPGQKIYLQIIVDLCKEKGDAFWAPPNPSRGIKRSNKEKLDKLILNFHYNGTNDGGAKKCSILLKMLMEHSEDNAVSSSKQNRYTEPYKKFWTYIYLVGGKISYETLAESLPIPSISSIYRYLSRKDPVIGGTLDVDGLVDHLTRGGYPFHVYVSDYVTKIKEDPRYDPTTDRIVGFVEPIDEHSLPKQESFKVNSFEDMINYNKTGKAATYIHNYIVQPQAENAVSYCLLMFATDLKFTTDDTIKRWDMIKKRLSERGIKVEGFVAEGDQRNLDAMKQKTMLGMKPEGDEYKIEWLHGDLHGEEDYVQDMVHVVKELKTRILQHSITLPIGNFIVSSSHLLWLIEQIPFSKHYLSMTALDTDDKMNFQPPLAICTPEVNEMLGKLPGAEATREYIKVMNFATHSYLSTDLNPLTRVYCILYSVFIFRFWRESLAKTEGLSVDHNCISLNTYTCLELNALALVKTVIRQIEKPELARYFLPWQKISQPCERWFKISRSITPLFQTALECTALEVRHKATRMKAIAELMAPYKFGEQLNFPRQTILNASSRKLEGKRLAVDLSDQAILNSDLSIASLNKVIEKAREDAFVKMKELGVDNIEIQDGNSPKLAPYTEKPDEVINEVIEPNIGSLENNPNQPDENIAGPNDKSVNDFEQVVDESGVIAIFKEAQHLRDYSDILNTSPKVDRFIRVKRPNGETMAALKSKLWNKIRGSQ